MTPHSQCHFTPINFVYKCSTTSATTKCRVINDYSDHSTSGEVSLNSCLQPVVDLENGIQGVLLQICSYPVTSHADVAKWFHQIAVSHKFRPLTTFFCRSLTTDGQMELGLGDPSWKLQPLQMKYLSMGPQPESIVRHNLQTTGGRRSEEAGRRGSRANLHPLLFRQFNPRPLLLRGGEDDPRGEDGDVGFQGCTGGKKHLTVFSLPTKGWISSTADDFDQQVRTKAQMELIKTAKPPKEKDKGPWRPERMLKKSERNLWTSGLQGASASILGYSYDRRLDKIGFQKTSYINLSKRTRGIRNPAHNLTNKEEIRGLPRAVLEPPKGRFWEPARLFTIPCD